MLLAAVLPIPGETVDCASRATALAVALAVHLHRTVAGGKTAAGAAMCARNDCSPTSEVSQKDSRLLPVPGSNGMWGAPTMKSRRGFRFMMTVGSWPVWLSSDAITKVLPPSRTMASKSAGALSM